MGCYSALAGGGSQVIICTLLFFCISIFGFLCLHIWNSHCNVSAGFLKTVLQSVSITERCDSPALELEKQRFGPVKSPTCNLSDLLSFPDHPLQTCYPLRGYMA